MFTRLFRFGDRFTALNNAYDAQFRSIAKQIGEEMKIQSFLKEGVYAMIGGPAYETPAELKMFKAMGIDAVGNYLKGRTCYTFFKQKYVYSITPGMSTVQEVIAARHSGLRCLALSVISNTAILGYDTSDKPSEQEVIIGAKEAENHLQELILTFLKRVQTQVINQPL